MAQNIAPCIIDEDRYQAVLQTLRSGATNEVVDKAVLHTAKSRRLTTQEKVTCTEDGASEP
jgi:hypothetical protein